MKPDQSKSLQHEYLTKLTLIGIFSAVFVIFLLWKQPWRPGSGQFQLSLVDWILLAFATLRLGRLIAYNQITEPLRAPFTHTVPDDTGAGNTVEPRGTGIRRTLGQLISCPICAGTWAAAILVYALYAFPGPARIFIAIMAAIGGAEVLNGMLEALSWSGQLSRARTGVQLARQKEQPVEPDEHKSQDYERMVREKYPNGNE